MGCCRATCRSAPFGQRQAHGRGRDEETWVVLVPWVVGGLVEKDLGRDRFRRFLGSYLGSMEARYSGQRRVSSKRTSHCVTSTCEVLRVSMCDEVRCGAVTLRCLHRSQT